MRSVAFLLLISAVAAGSVAEAQEVPQAFVGAHLIPIVGPEIPNGVLVSHEGTIVAVG